MTVPDLRPLRERRFRRLLAAQWASLIGDYIVIAALPFAVFSIGGSAGEVGLAFAASSLAVVALVLFGGVVGDRFQRRSVMIGADLLRFAAQAFLAVQLISGNAEFWQILAVGLLHGAGSAFFLPALSGLIPQTVSSERLAGANALRGLALASAAMIGPALAGILTAASGVGWAFALDAASFLLSAAFLARVRVEQEAPSAAERSAIRELLEGWAEFRRRTWLWAVVVEFALLNALVFAPFQVLGATVAKQALGGAGAWALILTGCGVGGLAGGILALSWRPRRPLLVGTLGIASWAAPLLLLAIEAPLGLIAAAAALAGGGLALFAAIWDTTLQSHVPANQLSRLSAYDWLGSLACLPIGYALAGATEGVVGAGPGLLFGAAVVLLATTLVAALPSVRQLRPARFRASPSPAPAFSSSGGPR